MAVVSPTKKHKQLNRLLASNVVSGGISGVAGIGIGNISSIGSMGSIGNIGDNIDLGVGANFIYGNNGQMELHDSDLISNTDAIGMYACVLWRYVNAPFPKYIISNLCFHVQITEISLGDTRLLEEHDLTNVLNQLPDDAFNDFFEGKIERYDRNR